MIKLPNGNHLRLLTLTGLLSAALLSLGACSTTRPAATQVSDAAITTKINAKFAADTEVNPFEIDVDTESGTVFLSGFVETEAARSEAEDLAQDTKGVKRVINRIKIGDLSAARIAIDALMVSNIKAKLTVDPQVAAHNIDVDVDRGVVTLKGIVRNDSQREEAERLAKTTEGVESVQNLIEIK